MEYPVLTENQLALKWQLSTKTLRRWRLNNTGPIWHKLFGRVRYHEHDIIEFEKLSSQYVSPLMVDNNSKQSTGLETAEELLPILGSEIEPEHVSAKEAIELTGLSAHWLISRFERSRKRIPHMLLIGNLRFSINELLQWELANSTLGPTPKSSVNTIDSQIDTGQQPTTHAPRWYEMLG